MALKFEVDLNNLEQYKNNLSGLLNGLESDINELENLIAQMHEFWGGDAAEAYMNLMTKRLKNARKVYKSLTKLRDAVNTQIDSIKEVDNVFEILVYELIHW